MEEVSEIFKVWAFRIISCTHIVAIISICRTRYAVISNSLPSMQRTAWMSKVSDPTKMMATMTVFMNPQFFANWMTAFMSPEFYEPM